MRPEVAYNYQQNNYSFNMDNSKKKRVAFYGFRQGSGGISHVMMNLMHGMLEHGLPVDLLLNHTNIPELDNINPGIRLVSLGKVNGLRRVPGLVQYLREVRPSILLSNREPANRVANIAQYLSKTQVRTGIRVGVPVSIALKRRHIIKRWLLRQSMVFCYRRANCLIANSIEVAEDISLITGVPFRQIHVINNPTISSDLFRLAEEPVDHPWFKNGNHPVILGVGRLSRAKDFPTLLRAFAELRTKRKCRLVILGEGKERHRLEQLATELGIREDMDLPGYAANPFAYMRRASLFVLSSAWEGSPNVLIQALALGLPVVATDCRSGPRHILSDGRYGPLTAVGDAQALSYEMLNVLDNPPSQQFQKTAAERFRADKCTGEYIAAMGIDL